MDIPERALFAGSQLVWLPRNTKDARRFTKPPTTPKRAMEKEAKEKSGVQPTKLQRRNALLAPMGTNSQQQAAKDLFQRFIENIDLKYPASNFQGHRYKLLDHVSKCLLSLYSLSLNVGSCRTTRVRELPGEE